MPSAFLQPRLVLLALGAGLLGACSQPEAPAPLPEVPRVALVLKDGKLHRPNQSVPFTGLIVERYPGGALHSRTSVSNGVLHGLSEGWFTNGVLQVREPFVAGKSHGTRIKWHPNGTKLSEAQIADGKLNGTFRRWDESGALAEQVELRDDQPDGISEAYYSSGSLKTRVEMRAGQVVKRETFQDGEVPRSSGSSTVASKPSS